MDLTVYLKQCILKIILSLAAKINDLQIDTFFKTHKVEWKTAIH